VVKQQLKNMVANLTNEESFGINKNESYRDSLNEKNLRSQLRSEVEKNISDKTITIIDSLNYKLYKGFKI